MLSKILTKDKITHTTHVSNRILLFSKAFLIFILKIIIFFGWRLCHYFKTYIYANIFTKISNLAV